MCCMHGCSGIRFAVLCCVRSSSRPAFMPVESSPIAQSESLLANRFELFVMSEGEITQRARQNLSVLLAELPKRIEVEIIDVLKAPHRAIDSCIYITPTLVDCRGGRAARLIGDLSDRDSATEFLLGS